MKKRVLTTILAAVIAQPVMAVAPNIWDLQAERGFEHYSIFDKKGQSLTVSCNSAGGDEDHQVYFTFKNGKSVSKESLNFVIDGSREGYLSDTNAAAGARPWVSFTQAISKGKNIDVYVNSKKVASFKPSSQSIKENAKYIADCTAFLYR